MGGAPDSQEPVVFGKTLGPRKRTGFYSVGANGNRQVGNGGVARLARAVGNDYLVLVRLRQLYGIDGFGERANLV